MTKLRKSGERGHFNHGWLDTYHTFSFSDYFDQDWMGFRTLRVINEDRVGAGQGFGTHPHRDMEIITYVLEGALQHKDSMGNMSVIKPGEVQRMTAGTGVTHSEFNPSDKEAVHLLQIWILPEKKNLKPGYEQRAFDPAGRRDRLRLIASRDGRDGSVSLNQDVLVYDSDLKSGNKVSYQPAKNRSAWIQTVKGTLEVNGQPLNSGDGLAIDNESALEFTSRKDSHFLLFDLG